MSGAYIGDTGVKGVNRLNSNNRISAQYTVGGASAGTGVSFSTVGGQQMAAFFASDFITFNSISVNPDSYVNKKTSKYVATETGGAPPTSFNWLIVAGGSHGGGGMGEGTQTGLNLEGQKLTVTVASSGRNNSSIASPALPSTIERTGGGSSGGQGQPGGSGGGAGRDGPHTGGSGNAGGYSPPEGNNGGPGCGPPFGGGGGGGGAGGSGQGARGCGPNNERGGGGGPGRSSNFVGEERFYSRGGTQGTCNGPCAGPGGPSPFGLQNTGDSGRSGVIYIKYST